MIDTAARVQAFLDTIRAAIAASTVDDAALITVTENGYDVERAFRQSAGAIVVYPMPAVEWVAPRTTRLVWTFAATVGLTDPGEVAARLTALLGILSESGLLKFGDRATPTDFKAATEGAPPIPGYTITHTEEHYS